jgi:hypothetical protein
MLVRILYWLRDLNELMNQYNQAAIEDKNDE